MDGIPGRIRGNMHVLLVASEWSVDAPYLARHVARVDPTRTLLYEGDDVDEDTAAIRRGEGWRFRRKLRDGVVTERLVVEGGVTPADLEQTFDYEDADWLKALLSGAEHSPEDPRWGVSVSGVRGSVLAHTRTAKLSSRPRNLAFALRDPEIAYGFLREFDLVLPVIPMANVTLRTHDERMAFHSALAGDDELASEDLRSWLAARKRRASPRIPAEAREKLEKGLKRIVVRWKKHGGTRARRLYGARVEHALVRLTAASARAAERQVATCEDADVALRLVRWSWETIAHLRAN